ncbi:hypothetical protein NDU88_003332 [Pleurodeles waltl]|uniref:Uncharacterized protein n=1 Tax=Pleurodeles waltl TaxID=8319 RepID=A0AAV7PCT4_PLEWA|nr:hypothetical protein NDU88_003332 [Pleurodeles waltl]
MPARLKWCRGAGRTDTRNCGNFTPSLQSYPPKAAGPLLAPEEAGEWKSGQATSGVAMRAGEGGGDDPPDRSWRDTADPVAPRF